MSNRFEKSSCSAITAGPPASGATARLLLIEDHVDTARIFRKLLEGAGYAIELVGTLAETRASLSAGRFDVIIADLSLPDGCLWDLLPLDGSNAKTPLIILTADGTSSSIERGRAFGVAAYLVKPISIHPVLDALRKALRPPTAGTLAS